MPSLPPPSARAGEAIGFSVRAHGFSSTVGGDGSVQFDDDSSGGWLGVNPLVGLVAILQFDTTDAAMRAARQDPYLAQKLRFLDVTRPERMRMRARHDEVVMRRALDDLPAYLAAVWQYRQWSAATRRRVLFALWDEAAEDGNALLREGGAEARRTILAFIAAHLPPGTDNAFAAAELAELNRMRQSRQVFAPYAPPNGPGPPGAPRPPDTPRPPGALDLALALHGL